MRRLLYISCILLSACAGNKTGQDELFLTNNGGVRIIQLHSLTDTAFTEVWNWRQEALFDSTDSMFNVFYSVDECKPVRNGSQVLITASWKGGVVLIERETQKILFYATGLANAHSAEILPGDKIAVAISTHEQGNRIAIFDLHQSKRQLFHDSLYSAHGVVWDDERSILWALGYSELRAYTLKDWNSDTPSLVLKQSFKIPGRSGHDLQAVPHSSDLFVTEIGHAWLFNRDSNTFRPYQQIPHSEHLKSIGMNPSNQQVVYIQGDSSRANSDHLDFVNPSRTIRFPGVVLYKARWSY